MYMQGQTDMQIYIQIDRQTDRQDLYINQSTSILLMDRQTDRQTDSPDLNINPTIQDTIIDRETGMCTYIQRTVCIPLGKSSLWCGLTAGAECLPFPH